MSYSTALYTKAMLQAKATMPKGPMPPLGEDREWAEFAMVYRHKAVSARARKIRRLKAMNIDGDVEGGHDSQKGSKGVQ